MLKAKIEAQNTADGSIRRDRDNRPLPYDPVVEALRVLARRGRKLREAEERAVAQVASGAGDKFATDTHEKSD